MCGICGIVIAEPEAEVDLPTLDAMTDVLEHRGPDGRGTFVRTNVGLGNRRLAIIDREGGVQPMVSTDGRHVITFNGEIYNYLELRSELLQRGYPLRTHSDTEVLLGLYACYGVEMLQRLNGMFAFALYDLERETLMLARDRFGEKPLYWFRDREHLLFASEIKALLASPWVKAAADYESLQQYVTFQYCLADRTLFEGVRRLPPATYALFDRCGELIETREYWGLDYIEDHNRGERYFVEELQFLLEDAVKIRLRSDVAVGTYLSGGFDSSIVSSVAAKLMGTGLPAFTGFFEHEGYSELEYARLVAQQNRSEHFEIAPQPEDFAANLGRMIWALDEPAAGPGAFAQLMVSQLAGDHVKVVLGGQGGDEIFGGYARYLVMYLEEAIKGSIYGSQDAARHLVTLHGILPHLSLLRSYVPLIQRFWSSGLFEEMERRYFALVTRDAHLERHFAPAFLAARDDASIYAAFERQFNEVVAATGGSSLFNRMTAYDTRTLLQSLLHVEDRMSMAASIESRLPLLDHRIAELMFKMPPAFKYREGRSKAALQAAAAHFVPDAILARSDKMGFPVPFVEWARGPLRDFVGDILLGERARARGIYDPVGVERLLEAASPFGRELWGILCLELWFRTFIDR